MTAADPNLLLLAVLVVLFLLLFLGLPIAFVLALTSAIYLYVGGISDITAVPLGMATGAKGFVLLAIPFFILAGSVMNSAGLTLPLAAWSRRSSGTFAADFCRSWS